MRLPRPRGRDIFSLLSCAAVCAISLAPFAAVAASITTPETQKTLANVDELEQAALRGRAAGTVEQDGAGTPIATTLDTSKPVLSCELPVTPACAPGGSVGPGVVMSFAKDNNALSTGRSHSQGMPMPVEAPGLVGKFIAAGGQSIAIGSDGLLWTWGRNDSAGGGGGGSPPMSHAGQLGWPRMTTGAKAGYIPSDLSFVAAASGRYHAAALDQEGRLFTWGLNDFGQLGRDAWESGQEPDITASSGEPCSSGGACHDAHLVEVPQDAAPERFVAVAAGRYHTVVASATGRVYTAGLNFCGNTQVRPMQLR